MKKRFPEGIEVDEITNAATYAYMQEKARRFLEVGYLVYTREDAFKLPGKDLKVAKIILLTLGCKQIMENRGLTKENPFVGLQIKGFYDLMRMFHFIPLQQQTSMIEENFIIDKITFQHRVMGEKERIVLFNKVIRQRR